MFAKIFSDVLWRQQDYIEKGDRYIINSSDLLDIYFCSLQIFF